MTANPRPQVHATQRHNVIWGYRRYRTRLRALARAFFIYQLEAVILTFLPTLLLSIVISKSADYSCS